MRKIKNIFTASVSSLAIMAVPYIALAQTDYDYETTLDSFDTVTSTDLAGAGLLSGGLFAGMIGLVAVVAILALVLFVLWLWALIDVLKRNFKNASTKKTWSWLVGLSWPLPIVLGWIPFLQWLSGLLGLAGLVVIIVYLASIRKQGTK